MTDPTGLTALLVEDEGTVAILIEDMLRELGYEVAASVANLRDACRIADTAEFDIAVLDVNLAGNPSYPVAAILRKRSIPFVFSTGYGASGIPPEFKAQPILAKPFSFEDLESKLSEALARRT